MSSRIAVWSGVLLAFFGAYGAYRYLFYDTFETLEDVDILIASSLNENPEPGKLIADLRAHDVVVERRAGSYYLRRHEYAIQSPDPIIILHIDEKEMLCETGPTSIESGIRFIFLPSYSELWLINAHNLEKLGQYRLCKQIRRAMFHGEFVYFKTVNGEFGRIRISR